MSILTRFNSYLGSSQYIFKDGKVAHFVKSLADKPAQYLTDVESEINELTTEIKNGHPHIFIPQNVADQTVDSEHNPLEALRAQIRLEERARLQAEMNTAPTAGRSETAAKPTLGGIATTYDIAGMTSEPTTVPAPIVGNQDVSNLPGNEQKPVEDIQAEQDATDGASDAKAAKDLEQAAADKLAALKAKTSVTPKSKD